MNLMRRAERWKGPVDGALISHLTGRADVLSRDALADPVGWALSLLGFDERPPRDAVQRRFRELVRVAHPDTAEAEMADPAERIAALAAARRILLS